MSQSSVFKIIPTTQKYDWGKIGLSSKVAHYAAASKLPSFVLDESAPYAELWMGTHSSSPSRLRSSGIALTEHLAAHPELMGARVVTEFKAAGAADGNLPFLLKILAIGKALSIQTHPDKHMAVCLHAEHPDIYKDANHKPEMALAITPFTALCGFLPLTQIATYLASTPEFADLIPPAIRDKFLSTSLTETPAHPSAKLALKDLFSAVMTAPEGDFRPQLAILVQRYESGGARAEEAGVKDLVLTLNSQFPGDIGVFCAFLLNYIKLQPGEAIFLAAGEPHAYVSGDIVECMATSDNVIRAGLTPKLRDIPNLVSGLTYDSSDATKHVVKPAPFPSALHTTLYNPPIPEFAVLRVELAAGESEEHPPIEGPSIAIVTEGAGVVECGAYTLDVSEGEVFFVGAGISIKLVTGDKATVIYRAYVEAS